MTLLNIANLHLVRGEYESCITELNNIIRGLPYDTDEELINIMRFRIMLSHLMLGNADQAEAVISGLTPLDDTPLYYYGKAALNIFHGKRQEAMMDVNSANNIFSKNQATIPYQRGITTSGLIDKYLPEINKAKEEAQKAPSPRRRTKWKGHRHDTPPTAAGRKRTDYLLVHGAARHCPHGGTGRAQARQRAERAAGFVPRVRAAVRFVVHG